MDERHAQLDPALAQALVGFLNFSEGRPDPKWQRQLNDAYAQLADRAVPRPWDALLDSLKTRLAELRSSGSAAFRDARQAAAVLDLATEVLPAYRRFHADLLGHLENKDLFGPFFLARVLEAILQLRQDEESPTADAVVARLNDFVGHRPVALLETRPQGEPYPHERHRPLPVYLKGAGVAWGRYQPLIDRTLDILRGTEASLLAEASFSFDLLDELAVDLRAYDHGHPVNRRPNYVFGEWDPHQLDRDDRDRHDQARYRRYVIRKVTLDALLERVQSESEVPAEERLVEAAAVLAGTILMGAGVSGWGPAAHDSSTTLATLLPRIARYRDAFYEQLLARLGGPHADRLRRERDSNRQAFAAARHHVNAFLARHRAAQMQQRYLALLFAEMGYPQASRTEAGRIQSVSVRLHSDLLGRLAAGQVLCEQGRLEEAARRLGEIEDVLQRGIDCGAFADPWNILGFQGLFPLSAAREDAIRDPRLEELIGVVEQTLNLYAKLMSEAAATGQAKLVRSLTGGMERLAGWWDPFATYEVGELRRLHGGEAVRSARNVARALGAWHDRGETTADLAFWRQWLGEFRHAKAFALVVEALLSKGDLRAALGLLVSWLGQAGEDVPLEDGSYSFHLLALRWMRSLTHVGNLEELPGTPRLPQAPFADRADLVRRFFDYLEANAEDYWLVPSLHAERPEAEEEEEEEDPEDRYLSAYEGVTYKDSTAGDEGAVADGGPPDRPFDLEEISDLLEKRLHFLATLARLWRMAARFLSGHWPEALEGWLSAARLKRVDLLHLLDQLAEHPLPEPSGDYESLVEFDRRRVLKEQLIDATISTCLEMTLAVSALRSALGAEGGEVDAPPWEAAAIRLEQTLYAGDQAAARSALDDFVERFRSEHLLFTPLSESGDGGRPRTILRVRTAWAVLRGLLANLPRVGLLRETFELLRTARSMEQAQPRQGRGITEFDHFFQSAYQAVVENVVRSAAAWGPERGSDTEVVRFLERLSHPFLGLWIEHSRTLQLSVLEHLAGDDARAQTQWRDLAAFVRRYGGELFHARFLTLSNIRGILHRGVDAYLDYLGENVDPLKPSKLVEDLEGGTLRREEAVRRLELVLQAVAENYEEYKDYNTTTTQSDYGENLHVLLDFLRLKVAYDKHAWQFRPLVLAHEVLARHGRASTALRWEGSMVRMTHELAGVHLEQLARLQTQHGVRLGTVSDRLGERFVKPLALDRLCALIAPCLEEARKIEAEAERPSFARLRQELGAYTTSPTGVGLDVPAWLRRLEAEVRRAQAASASLAASAESFFRVPRRPVSYEEVHRQLREWERPALPG